MRVAGTGKHTSLREVNRRKTDDGSLRPAMKISSSAKHHPNIDTKFLKKLKDVCLNTPAIGEVLSYNGTCWENVTVGAGGPVSWIGLVDTFEPNYTGKAGFLSTVNPGETGLILTDPNTFLVHALDSPLHTDVDNTNKAINTVLVWTGVTHEYIDITTFVAAATGGTRLSLTDTPSTFLPGNIPIVNALGTALEFITPNALICNCDLRNLSDVNDTGIGPGYMLIRNGTEHVYVDPNTIVAGASTFISLSDTPAGYGGSNGYILQVSGSSVIFTDPTTLFTDNYLGLGDTPANYTNQAGYVVSVNQGENGLSHNKPSLGKRRLNGDFNVNISAPDAFDNVYFKLPADGFDGNEALMDDAPGYALDIQADGWYSVSLGGSVEYTNGTNGIRIVMLVNGSRNDVLLDCNTSQKGNEPTLNTEGYVFQYYQEDIVRLAAGDTLTTLVKVSVPSPLASTTVIVRTGRALLGNGTGYTGLLNPESGHSFKATRHSPLYIS